MNENSEKLIENLSEEQQATAEEWLAKYATEEVSPEKHRECGPEVLEIEAMFAEFEKTHNIDALNAVTLIELAPGTFQNPIRDPAKLALNPIYKKMTVIKDETNVTLEQYDELKIKWKRISQAVGMINNNELDHSAR